MSTKKTTKAVSQPASKVIEAIKAAELAGARLSKTQIMRMLGGVK